MRFHKTYPPRIFRFEKSWQHNVPKYLVRQNVTLHDSLAAIIPFSLASLTPLPSHRNFFIHLILVASWILYAGDFARWMLHTHTLRNEKKKAQGQDKERLQKRRCGEKKRAAKNASRRHVCVHFMWKLCIWGKKECREQNKKKSK